MFPSFTTAFFYDYGLIDFFLYTLGINSKKEKKKIIIINGRLFWATAVNAVIDNTTYNY